MSLTKILKFAIAFFNTLLSLSSLTLFSHKKSLINVVLFYFFFIFYFIGGMGFNGNIEFHNCLFNRVQKINIKGAVKV